MITKIKYRIKRILSRIIPNDRLAWCRAAEGSGKICITFDDGPNEQYTQEVLRVLRENNAKATFFLIGKNIERHPHIVKKLVDEGHEAASHGYSHTGIEKLDRDQISREIERTDHLLSALGVKASLFRPPYGTYKKKDVGYINKLGKTMVLWSIDSFDYDTKNKEEIIENIDIESVNSGDILLFHDDNPRTPASLEFLLGKLQERGFQAVTVSSLIAEKERQSDV